MTDPSSTAPGGRRGRGGGDPIPDLDRLVASVVSIKSAIPADAFTAETLGTERTGSGVVIGDRGLVLTIGYLVTEAESVWLGDGAGRAAPAHVVAVDQETGFGLVQALAPLRIPPLPIGDSESLRPGQAVVLAGASGPGHAIEAVVVARREFAGYWEYLLDNAIFTSPAHPNWGGAALIGSDGRLLGIGSLFVRQVLEGQAIDGNMVVPIDLLKPILDELLRFGRTNRPGRPWLGIYTAESDGRLVIAGLARNGPAQRAGVEVGDVIAEVADEAVGDLAGFYRAIWALGTTGVVVPLTLLRDDHGFKVEVPSASRADFLRRPRLH